MEYDHGRRLTAHLHEMTPLERAITAFEEQAKKAHSHRNAPPNETNEQRIKRENSLAKALHHLKAERAIALAMVDIHGQLDREKLDSYQSKFRMSDSTSDEDVQLATSAMEKERHHPTRLLATFMRLDGRPKPGPRFDAHHIASGKGRSGAAYEARIQLHYHGIRINDPDNGVWMPRSIEDKGHWAMPNAPAHAEIHTIKYEEWVLTQVNNQIDEVACRAKLVSIRTRLKDGNHPDYIIKKK